MSNDVAPRGQADPVMAGISREMVRLYKEQFGRGPKLARTYWAGPDVVVTMLEDTLTTSERNMVDLGEQQRLRETRMFFQYVSVTDFCEPVERLTSRRVRGFISGIDVDADGLAAELFVLHPVGYDGPGHPAIERERNGRQVRPVDAI